MEFSNLLGILSALTSAALFGGGDFSGGLATRRNNPFQVIVLSGISSIAIMAALMVFNDESFPTLHNALWAASAGTSGALGLALLYRALAIGNTAVVSPTASVVGTILPVLFGIATEGLPSPVQTAGFLVAVLGIWLAAQTPATSRSTHAQKSLVFAVLAGIGFGGFYILITRVQSEAIFAPLIIARTAGAAIALVLMLSKRLPLPSPKSNPIALLAGALDVSANAFYLIATHAIRLDVAVVLSSLSPVVTVLLASRILKEEVSWKQWVGVILCLTAIDFITL